MIGDTSASLHPALLSMDLQNCIDLLTVLEFQNGFVPVSLVVLWGYDCFLTLDREVSLIYGPPWKKGSILYVMTRYSPVFLLCVHLYMIYLQSERIVTCKFLHTVWYCVAALCVACAEGIFVLRTYALWGNKRSILALMLSTILCLGILDVIITMTISKRLELQLSDMGGGLLTMIRVYWAYRERGCLLLDILLQHSIFYFVTGLTLSVVNILAIEYFIFSYSDIFATFQIIMHTIVVTRMHLQFCTTSQVCDSSTQSGTTHSQLTQELTQVELQTYSHSDA
ncbi:hypothetical protein BDR07DRAFT_1426544 [Suillus spraguei]|nr:hypothetical protein BDR07DRAFT_1426544 [Suillus spraguei]